MDYFKVFVGFYKIEVYVIGIKGKEKFVIFINVIVEVNKVYIFVVIN